MMKIKRINQAALVLKTISALNLKGGKFPSATLILLAAIFAVTLHAAPQSAGVLNGVDPNFNVQIQTNNFSVKVVLVMLAMPDDKMVVSGQFNSFNRQPVTGLIRLNADGLLDTTFNNNLIAEGSYPNKLFAQPDGKILVAGPNLKLNGSNAPLPRLFRLNADGTIDSTFNFFGGGNLTVYSAEVGADGKILVAGNFPQVVSGVTVYKSLLRLNPDGTNDDSFEFGTGTSVSLVALQNGKPVIAYYDISASQDAVTRLNTDGSFDSSFARILSNNSGLSAVTVAPDNKILVQTDHALRRFDENGGVDGGFQVNSMSGNGAKRKIYVGGDGKITYAFGINSNTSTRVRRILPNGAADPTFTNYDQASFGAFAVQSDGEVFVGDQTFTTNGIFNKYTRLFSSGAVDAAFNPGGIGFQTIFPGSIGAIGVQPDQKIVVAGNFDLINNVTRAKIARLNPDNTIDGSFQLNTNPTGNYFTRVAEVYTLDIQPNGKIVLSGLLDYVVNGSAKMNVVRLNADGSIDPTFNIGALISDFYGSSGAGKNKTATQGDGRIVVASSRSGLASSVTAPIRFTPDGARDSTFNPTLYGNIPGVFIYDVAVQPDRKILISGVALSSGDQTSFIARLNADGSVDESFQRNEQSGKVITEFDLLADGKVIIVKANYPYYTTTQSVVSRLNADGSTDAAFAAGSGANGVVNATLVMSDGQILVGGKFTTFDGETRHNLALLNADGSLAPTTYTVNQEVLSLAVDGEGRVLVGGRFTTINVNGGENYARSYVARLTNASRTRFDFDGDGRADLGVFTASSGNWSIFNSQTNQISDAQFGQAGDRIAPADYDGDGKTDIAVYRPSRGIWYVMRSTAGFAAYQWGAGGDKPVADDYDGDGKADIAVWRPSNGVWYILRNNGSPIYHHFGAADDLPVPADYDGDGKTDIAVWRPSNGTFYWLASGSNNRLKGAAFGQTGDVPAVGDYDGDGKADLVVFRPSTGVWHQYLTAGAGGYSYSAAQFGQAGDEPVAADYDGDGRADIAVRRQGVWHLLKSNQGYTAVSFGGANAQAVAASPNQ